ncbi:hypothetical protein F0562_027899 [Nyssa sinensis]|uniref:Uncharacterized protein n=1 Tax=Nyssa sinensis TaxID=561372 RepID=A0A5J5B6M6_9ASTE|nr:hypothetical protein F0562_027899 [Nyssa sinensis]
MNEDQVTESSLQAILPSTTPGASVSAFLEVPASPTYHVATNSPSVMVARTPTVPQKSSAACPGSDTTDTPSMLSWANLANSGDYIPKEALDLEKEYGGFSLNTDFLVNPSVTPSRSSLNGGRGEGRHNSGRGEWHARPMSAGMAPLVQNVCDTFASLSLPLRKAVAPPSSVKIAPVAASYRGMVTNTFENLIPQQPNIRSVSNTVQAALDHSENSETATSWPPLPSSATVTQQIQKEPPPTAPHSCMAPNPPANPSVPSFRSAQQLAVLGAHGNVQAGVTLTENTLRDVGQNLDQFEVLLINSIETVFPSNCPSLDDFNITPHPTTADRNLVSQDILPPSSVQIMVPENAQDLAMEVAQDLSPHPPPYNDSIAF